MSDAERWRVNVSGRAERDLKRLPARDQARVRAAIDALEAGPGTGDIRKLRGKDNEWRLRVGDWRVRFRPDFQQGVIYILHVRPRGEAYRD